MYSFLSLYFSHENNRLIITFPLEFKLIEIFKDLNPAIKIKVSKDQRYLGIMSDEMLRIIDNMTRSVLRVITLMEVFK